VYQISVNISTAQTNKTPSQECPRDGIALYGALPSMNGRAGAEAADACFLPDN